MKLQQILKNTIDYFKIRFTKLNTYFKKIKRILKKIDINISIAILSLFISYQAYLVSKKALDHADEQFKINSKSSDSLFNVQLKHTKELNDSLINQIGGLQNITQKQLIITDEQLRISKESLSEQIYSSRPKIVVILDDIADTNNVNIDVYSPKITTVLKNNGSRFALNTSLRPFVVFNNYQNMKYGLFPKQSFFIEPDKSIERIFLPKFPIKYRNDFYYLYDISYYDDALKRTFKKSYFYHYYKMRNIGSFYSCEDDEKKILIKNVNDELKRLNEPLIAIE